MQVAKSYKATVFTSIGVAFTSVVVGLTLSFYYGLKPGGTIVLVSILCLLIAIFVKYIVHQNQLTAKK